jgi:nuclear transcription factor Y gamma
VEAFVPGSFIVLWFAIVIKKTILFFYSQAGNQSDLPSSGILPGTTYAQQHFAQNHELQEQLSKFWSEMRDEVDNVGTDPAEFKSQQLPLARIKKVRHS